MKKQDKENYLEQLREWDLEEKPTISQDDGPIMKPEDAYWLSNMIMFLLPIIGMFVMFMAGVALLYSLFTWLF